MLKPASELHQAGLLLLRYSKGGSHCQLWDPRSALAAPMLACACQGGFLVSRRWGFVRARYAASLSALHQCSHICLLAHCPAAAAADCRAQGEGSSPEAVQKLLEQPRSSHMWPPAVSLALALTGSLGRQVEVNAPVESGSNGSRQLVVEEAKLSAAGALRGCGTVT